MIRGKLDTRSKATKKKKHTECLFYHEQMNKARGSRARWEGCEVSGKRSPGPSSTVIETWGVPACAVILSGCARQGSVWDCLEKAPEEKRLQSAYVSQEAATAKEGWSSVWQETGAEC